MNAEKLIEHYVNVSIYEGISITLPSHFDVV